jgi:hypothetical protein
MFVSFCAVDVKAEELGAVHGRRQGEALGDAASDQCEPVHSAIARRARTTMPAAPSPHPRAQRHQRVTQPAPGRGGVHADTRFDVCVANTLALAAPRDRCTRTLHSSSSSTRTSVCGAFEHVVDAQGIWTAATHTHNSVDTRRHGTNTSLLCEPANQHHASSTQRALYTHTTRHARRAARVNTGP